MRSLVLAGMAGATFLLLAIGGASPAPAAHPGARGVIAYTSVAYDAGARRSGYLGAGDIRVVAPDGSGDRALTRGRADDVQPAFSPDGTQIAFSRARPGSSPDLHVVGADGTGLRRLTRNIGSDAPSWSPDGARLVFDARRGIYSIAADGTGLARLTRGSGGLADLAPAWAPDGSAVVFTRGRARRTRIVRTALWTMVPDGSGARALLGGSGALTFAQQADVSPDGRRIVFAASGRSPGSRSALYVAGIDGTGVRQIASDRRRDFNGPAFSPDGMRVVAALAAGDGRRGGRLVVIDPATSYSTTVVRVRRGAVAFPSWQPVR